MCVSKQHVWRSVFRCGAMVLCLAVAVPASATVIDNFTNNTLDSNWVQSTVLDNSPGNTGTYSFDTTTNDDMLTAVHTGYVSGAKQEVLLRSDYSLNVGDTVLLDTPDYVNDSEGLVVATATGITTRAKTIRILRTNPGTYIQVGYMNDAGTDTKTSYASIADCARVYIRRDAEREYDLGYVNSSGLSTDLHTFTLGPTATCPGDAMGIWVDTRSNVNVRFDTFERTSIPEPSTLILLTLGMAGLLCYAWRKRK